MDKKELDEYLNRLQAATNNILGDMEVKARCTFAAAGVDDTLYVRVPGLWPGAAADLVERLDARAGRNVEVLV